MEKSTKSKYKSISPAVSNEAVSAGTDFRSRPFETPDSTALESGSVSSSFNFGKIPISHSGASSKVQLKSVSLPKISVASNGSTQSHLVQRRKDINGDNLTFKTWKSFSSLGIFYKRSTDLQEIDQAVSLFEQQKDIDPTDDNYSKKMDALNRIEGAIISWKRTKKEKPKEAESLTVSKRLTYVDQLANIVTNKKRQLSIAAFPDKYSQLAVFSEGSMTDNSGAFLGDSAKAYEAYKKRLEKKWSKNQKKTTLDAKIRIAMLITRVKEAHEKMQEGKKGKGKLGTQVIGLFTAQEWYFKHPGTPFDSTDKQAIVKAFQSLSAKYTDMVIVPGSIVWGTGKSPDLELRNTAVAFMNGMKLHETNKRSEGFDIDGYRELDPKTGRSIKSSKAEWIENWRRGGGIVPEDKAIDNSATDSALFNVGPLSFSLEICADHGGRRALKDMQERQIKPAKGAHVQILVSHGAALMNGSSAMRPGGIGVSTDGTKHSDELGGVRKVYQEYLIEEDFSQKEVVRAEIKGDSLQKEVTEKKDLSNSFMGIYELPA